MHKGRLEAFSDGVFAILITIMVLELKAPHGDGFTALLTIFPNFAVYALSFIYLGIYWNNHHHLMQAAAKVNGTVLWANLHLLFWLSLLPFATSWINEAHFAPLPVALYGAVLLACSGAYFVLARSLIRMQSKTLESAIKDGRKEKISSGAYAVAMLTAFFKIEVSIAIYIGVATMWLVPDRRIEKKIINTIKEDL